MDIKLIEETANSIREQLGGRLFAFPIEPSNPHSKYAVTFYTDSDYKTYPDLLVVEEAAAGVASMIDGLKQSGRDIDFERDVRFVSYDAQINAPSVTMRKLKKEGSKSAVFKNGEDVIPRKNEGDYLISAQGVIKFSYISMIDDKLPRAVEFMDEYYKLLSMKRYGKTAAAIKQEVRRMSKDQAIKWIEKTYNRYITDSMEVMNIMQSLKAKTSSP